MDAVRIEPRIFVNGFPKAGTHLALSLVSYLGQPFMKDDEGVHAFGTFVNHAFSDEWMDKRLCSKVALEQPPGTWIKGHAGWFKELELSFDYFKTCVIFIYRDLRDVAVSILHHVSDGREHLLHPFERLYLDLPTNEARLLAIINGIGPDPGLIKRWGFYAPWLAVDWVLKLRFEDILWNTTKAIRDTIGYCLTRTMGENSVSIPESEYNRMLATGLMLVNNPKEYSVTYRGGRVGDWRDEFTPAVHDAFEAAGGAEWNKRLGYGTRRQ